MQEEKNCLIIAEAGVNHNGSLDLALQLVDAAAIAGADIVKFQSFKAKNLVTKEARQAEYQAKNSGKRESQYDMLKRLELSVSAHKELVAHCKRQEIEFLSTAFDEDSLELLISELGLKRLKIPSGEINNAPLLLSHAKSGSDLIVSTGMATLSEIEKSLGVIAFGFLAEESEKVCQEAFDEAYSSGEGRALLKEKVSLLHCTSEYPAPMCDINLNALDTLASCFKLPVGYSDHSEGILIPIAAVAKGATVLEKHFTLDRTMEGPDHKMSLEPSELESMVSAIRSVENALGDGIKGPRPSELKNKHVVRKSLVACRDIEVGELFTSDNLAIMRPGNGVSPYSYWSYLGEEAKQSFKAGELISE